MRKSCGIWQKNTVCFWRTNNESNHLQGQRDKEIVRDAGDDYERLKERGKTDEDIAALVEEFNGRENCPQTVEIVELDEVAEFYRTQELNAYKEQLNDFAFMEDRLDELSRMIESYIDEAKKAYKEEE